GLLLAHPIVAAEIAADIARGNTKAARGGDEDVGEVATGAALERKSLGGRGCGARGSGIVGHVLVQPSEHQMQEVEHVATGGVAACGRETGDIWIGTGERGRAQIEAPGGTPPRPPAPPLGGGGGPPPPPPPRPSPAEAPAAGNRGGVLREG